MRFLAILLFTTIIFGATAKAQKTKFKSILDVITCSTENCITQFMVSYGFSFINKEMQANKTTGVSNEISHYKKGNAGNKKYITAVFEKRGDVALLEYRFTDDSTYQNLLKQLPQGFGGGKEILTPEENAYFSKYLFKGNPGVAIVFKRPVKVSTTDPYIISVQFEK